MKLLRVPVAETVTASYLIPLRCAMTVTEARQRTIKAVGTHVPEPLRTVILHWIRQGAVTIHVVAARDNPLSLPDGMSSVIAEQLTQLAKPPAFAQVTATSAASLIVVHELMARGPAAALAASIGAPLIDAQAIEVLTTQEALGSLPDTWFPDAPSSDLSIGFALQPWVRLSSFADQDRHWAISDGMWRFGLPEFMIGGCERDLRKELEEILFGVIFRVWSGLAKDAQATHNARDLVRMPRSVQIPAEMQIHRKDLDRARGVPNRGGAWMTVGLHFHPSPQGRNWLTVCPPSWWDWDEGGDFLADLCHAMFGFEKPTWYYLPHIGAVVEAVGSLPEARRRFNDGELPPGGQLMVRYDMPDDEGFRWARVESWTDSDLVMVRAIGRELAPIVKAGRAVPVETKRIFDWAIWTDDKGAAEGARTECVGYGF